MRLLRRRVDLKMESLLKGAGEFLADCTNPKLPQNDNTVKWLLTENVTEDLPPHRKQNLVNDLSSIRSNEKAIRK